MIKSANTPAARKAAERVDKLLLYIIENSPADEVWKEISFGDGYYFISSKGRVISLCYNQPRVLKPYLCNDYLCVSIYGHDRRINRLVADAFIDNPENKPIAHHKDHNKLNNTVDNLEWATHKENTIAYYANEREKKDQEEREAAAE